MSFRARIQPILVSLCLTALVLQGCSVSSDGGGDGGDGRGDGSGFDLDLTTAGNVLTIVIGGNDVVIQLTVTDSADNGVSGVEARFTTNAGTLTPDGLTESTDTTDADGVATAILTSSDIVETATVIAEALGFSQAIRISFVSGVPATVGLSAVPSVVQPGETTTVRVIVRDANAVPVEGVTVSLSIPTNNTGGSLTPTSGTTGSSGEVFAEYTGGLTLGTDVVQGDIGSLSGTVELAVQTTEVIPTNIQLFVSPSPQLDSDKDPKGDNCAQVVTLTARVTDNGNNVVQGIDVAFSVDFGNISVLNGTTDDDGLASAQLDICGDPTNRPIGDATNPPITATATAGTLIDTEQIAVTGTTLTVSGATSAVQSDTDTLTLSLLLRDASGDGIPDATINLESSLLGNPLPPSVTTDSNGQATFEYTPVGAGEDTIIARALGAVGLLDLTISDDSFVLTIDDFEPEINQVAVIRVRWVQGGSPVVGETVSFSATRGVLSGGDVSASVDRTNGNGVATVNIIASSAGASIITASGDVAGGPSSQISIEFVATDPATLFLQAEPTTVGVNLNGVTDQQSIITAIVRDPDGNLVKNQTVRFVLNDTTGGTIFPAEDLTDSFGRASTVYTAGATPSAQDGVIIDAEVLGIPPGCQPAAADPGGACDRVTLTVAQQQMFVVLGTGNDIVKDGELYRKPYTVLVTDVNGNPIANATVELNLYPTRFEKGFYTHVFNEEGNCVGWGKVRTVTGTSLRAVADDVDQACDNEDRNRNGFLDPQLLSPPVLDSLGNPISEDTNRNGTLEPANPAAPLGTVTTNVNGFGFFNVNYAREFTWVEVEIEARVTVGGSEGFSTARFFLPGLATDFANCDVAPPGLFSAFGQADTCDCDELNQNDTHPIPCRTRTSLQPVQFSQVSGPDFIPAAGGAANAVEFRVFGGGEISYQVFLLGDSAGTLRDSSGQTGDVINVAADETFFLEALPNQFLNPRTLSFFATDDTTGIFSATEDVIQEASTPITLARTAGAVPVPVGGGVGALTLSISGGTDTTYTVSTTLGTFSAPDVGATITGVTPSDDLVLDIPDNTGNPSLTFTVTGIDELTGNTGTLDIDQDGP